MRYITIYECYDKLNIGKNSSEKSITYEEAEELERYIINEKLDSNNILWSRDSITFINYVGFIKLSTVSIEILPKIYINSSDYDGSRKALLNMLNKSGIVKFNYSSLSMLNIYDMNLNEIFSLIFARTLQKQLSKGAYLEYINIEENTKSLKGKILVKDHIKNISRGSSNVFCKFEEFSINNKLNKIFKTCIYKIVRNVKNFETIKILSHMQVVFSEVNYIDTSSKDNLDYKFTRLSSRFEENFLLAKMILGSYSSIGNKGSDKSFAILFEMNNVYERYITNLLRRNLDKYIIHSQHNKYKLLRNENTDKDIFSLILDIVIEVDNKERLIIDTKWKRINESKNRHGVKREDLYQMYAYLTRYKDVKSSILLYPSAHEDNKDDFLESWYLESDKEKKIRIYTIDLYNEANTIDTLKYIISKNL